MAAQLTFCCPKCKKETPVNMENAQVKSGNWKSGTKVKMFCFGCGKNTSQVIK